MIFGHPLLEFSRIKHNKHFSPSPGSWLAVSPLHGFNFECMGLLALFLCGGLKLISFVNRIRFLGKFSSEPFSECVRLLSSTFAQEVVTGAPKGNPHERLKLLAAGN